MTRVGWLFLGVSILVGLAAVRSQAPLMFVLFGGMMGALHISAILARRMLSAVQLKREAPSHVWQHRTVHIGYFLRNTRRRRACLAIGVEQAMPESMESTSGYCAHLPGGGSFRAGARFIAGKRGRFELQSVRLKTLFPFGLIEAKKCFDEKSPLVVWPARGRLKRRLLHHGAVESSVSAPSGASGGQDEFFGLREYRDGDNPRWIHWRRSAGRSAPVVREMSRPLPEILWVILDTRQSQSSQAASSTRERMIRFAATLIDHAFSRQYKVGLALAYGDGPRIFPAGAGLGQRRSLLDGLADIGSNKKWRLGDAARLLGPAQLKEALVVAVTANRDPAQNESLWRIRRSCRHLEVISPENLEHFFDDPVPAAKGK
jgi:uncharacterized protein (DUF58 family)